MKQFNIKISRQSLLMGVVFFLFITITISCSKHDDDYIPYGLIGMDVYVYNNETDVEYYAGRVDGNYFKRDKVLASCGNLAYSTASQKYLDDWSYICCTVTKSSNCTTKVR